VEMGVFLLLLLPDWLSLLALERTGADMVPVLEACLLLVKLGELDLELLSLMDEAEEGGIDSGFNFTVGVFFKFPAVKSEIFCCKPLLLLSEPETESVEPAREDEVLAKVGVDRPDVEPSTLNAEALSVA